MTKLFTVIEWASAYKLTNVQVFFFFFWGHMYLHRVYCKSHYPPEKESKLSAWCLKHTTHTNRLHPSTSLLYASTRSVQKKICVITHKTVLMHAQGQKPKTNKQKNWNEKQIHIHKQIHKHWWMLIPDQTRKPPWFFFLYKCTSDRLKDKIVTASNIHLRQAIIYRVKHASLIIAHRCTLTHGKTEPTELWGLLFAESNTSCCC